MYLSPCIFLSYRVFVHVIFYEYVLKRFSIRNIIIISFNNIILLGETFLLSFMFYM